jgi:predicted sulfurtransferase
MISPSQSHTFAGRAFLFDEKYTNKSRTASCKPAKECACPAQKKKFSKMPHARLKRKI